MTNKIEAFEYERERRLNRHHPLVQIKIREILKIERKIIKLENKRRKRSWL